MVDEQERKLTEFSPDYLDFKAGVEAGRILEREQLLKDGWKSPYKEILDLAQEIMGLAQQGDYSNGVEAQGMDQGRVLAYEYLQQLDAKLQALKSKYGSTSEETTNECECEGAIND